MAGRKYKKYNFNADFEAHGYPESSWPLLNEYLSRSAAEFGLNDKEVRAKLDTMLQNLDTIEIDDRPDSSLNATYNPEEKKITLNYAGMSARNESYVAHLCAMFHELGHVGEDLLAEDPNSFIKVGKNGRLKGVSFNEILTEMKAARLTMNMRLSADMGPGSDPKCMMRHVGYNDLIFAGTMVHTALGVSEKEFLSAAEKGPEHFREVMSKKFSDPKAFDTFMARVTFITDTMHSIKYNPNRKGQLTQTDYRNITNLTASLYHECLTVMDARMSAEVQKGVDPKTFSEKRRYEMERLAANYEHGLRTNTPYTIDQLNDVPALAPAQEKLAALEVATSMRKKLGKKTFEQLVAELNLEDVNCEQVLSKYGLTLPSIADTPAVDTSEYKKEFLEDDYGTDYWDNKEPIGSIKEMETDDKIPHVGTKEIPFRPRVNATMDKLNALNTLDEVASYDSGMAVQSEVEVDVKVKSDDKEI